MHQALQLALAVATLSAGDVLAGNSSQGVFSGWFPSWVSEAGDSPLSNYNEVSFFAALTTPSGLTWDGKPSAVFSAAINGSSGTNSLLSLGGWGGSRYFSDLLLNDTGRDALTESVRAFVKQGSFKGIDIDWDFPNAQAANEQQINWDISNFCNSNNAGDYDNLITWVKEVREKLKADLGAEPTISAAVPMSGFNDKDGQKVQDASALVADGVFDYISVMVYDVAHNYRNDTGINAPLDIKDAPSDQQFSIKMAVDYWVNIAKVPANKIQLALPAYGKIFQTTQKELSDSKIYNAKTMPKTSADDSDDKGNVQADDTDTQAVDQCGIWRDFGATYTYAGLFANGTILDSSDAAGETTLGSWKYYWDDTTSSPFLYDDSRQLFITYDNPKSITAKASWAKEQGLLGIKIYPATGDNAGQLIQAAKAGYGS